MIVSSQMLNTELSKLAKILMNRKQMCTTAESCTGGMIAAAMTSLAGSSNWFERGFVTYSNDAKHELLGVPASLIEQYGAVSLAVGQAMAEGAIAQSNADYSVATSGIAGPGGGTDDKPVGTVCFGWASNDLASKHEVIQFNGDREAVRLQATTYAIKGLIKYVLKDTRESLLPLSE